MIAAFSFPVVVLAAGQSTRMRGVDKLLEDVDGQPLLRRQVLMARTATRGDVIVALPPEPHPRHDLLQDLPVIRLGVPDAKEGINASLRAAFAALPPARCAMLLLADLPELETADLLRVARAVDLSSDRLIWRGTTQDGAPGHPVVFAAGLFPAFQTLRGDSGGREIVALAKGKVALIPLRGDRARRDLDTPEDWAAWRKARGQTAAD